MNEQVCALRQELAANRPRGFALWFEHLRQHALGRQLAACVRLLEALRREAEPLSATESNRLLMWESQLLGYLGLASQRSGQSALAEDAYRRCKLVRQKLMDLQGLRQLDLVSALLTMDGCSQPPNSVTGPLLANAETDLQAHTQTSILTEFLDHEHWRVRRQALEALVDLRSHAPVISALSHADAQTRWDAACLIAESQVYAPEGSLLSRLDDDGEDPYVRWWAARLLGQNQGNKAAVQALLHARWANHPLVRVGAVEGLVLCLGSGAREAILPLQDNPAPEVRLAVKKALDFLSSG